MVAIACATFEYDFLFHGLLFVQIGDEHDTYQLRAGT